MQTRFLSLAINAFSCNANSYRDIADKYWTKLQQVVFDCNELKVVGFQIHMTCYGKIRNKNIHRRIVHGANVDIDVTFYGVLVLERIHIYTKIIITRVNMGTFGMQFPFLVLLFIWWYFDDILKLAASKNWKLQFGPGTLFRSVATKCKNLKKKFSMVSWK